jgi:very-short-patch-repair endonuclease
VPKRKRKKIPQEKKDYAKRLRENSTPSEKLLWKKLRKEQMGVRFRTQVIVHGWITDFYCRELGLVLEVDGKIHDHHLSHDRFRDETLRKYGIETLRVKNEDVEKNMIGVLSKIKRMIEVLRSKERLG